ncbi:hypothetical protein ASG65_16625 [Bacillus sp. Leaf13]|nr:hypothetical protein ASG65_16625 [Bacillus sp. Leaf13]
MYPGLKGRLTGIREKQLLTAGRAKVVFPTSKIILQSSVNIRISHAEPFQQSMNREDYNIG